MANATPVTTPDEKAPEATLTQDTQADTPAQPDATPAITEVIGEAVIAQEAPKAAKVKEKSAAFTNGIKRETY